MYERAIEIDENAYNSIFHLGTMHHKNQNFYEALKCYSKSLKYYKEENDVYIRRGKVYQDMGNHQFAIRDFNDALTLDPENVSALFHLGISQLKSKNFHDAELKLNQALELGGGELTPGIYDGLG